MDNTLSGSPTHDVSDQTVSDQQDHHIVKFGPLVSLLIVIIQSGWDNQPKLKSFCEFKRTGHVPILNLEIMVSFDFFFFFLAANTHTRNKSNQKLGMALWLVNGPQLDDVKLRSNVGPF